MKIVAIEYLGVSEQRMEEMKNAFQSSGHSFEYFPERESDNEKLKDRIGDAEILILANQPLHEAVILAATHLKYIAVAFTGFDHVNIDACNKKGIKVSNAAGFSNQSVAELSVGMAIAMLREFKENEIRLRTHKARVGFGNTLAGKTVGIVGTGSIGMDTAKLFKAFGCKIIGYSRSERAEAIAIGMEYCSLESLLSRADIISLHVPLTDSTKGMIGHEALDMMKPTAYLINTARGAVIDQKALNAAVSEGKIAGAALDIYDIEPPLPKNHDVLQQEKILALPHIAFATEEAIVLRADITFENVNAWISGKPVRLVN